jgi:hypothetical protein
VGYPDLPKNRLIVDGIDLTERFRMILEDGYTLEPPEPKTYTVDIPGGNGQIDLTEALSGDVSYSNRKQEFTFYVVGVKDFEAFKSEISQLLHGKAFDYKITMDPEYTYHGRFTVSSYNHGMYTVGKVGKIVISIDADPYKTKGFQTLSTNTAGGVLLRIQNGRKPVQPTIETDGSIKVICNGVEAELPAGSWTVNDLLFKAGVNELYLRAMEYAPTTTWSYLGQKTWGEIKSRRWFEWMYAKDDSEEVTPKKWSDIKELKWSDVSSYRWSDLTVLHKRLTEEAIVYIRYEWSDL